MKPRWTGIGGLPKPGNGERKESRKEIATLSKKIFFFNEHGDSSQATLVLFLSAETAAWNAQEVKSQTEMFLEARQALL